MTDTIFSKVAYIDTEGTFRPDRIKSIADRFGIDGDAALENILYGQQLLVPLHSFLLIKLWYLSLSPCLQ